MKKRKNDISLIWSIILIAFYIIVFISIFLFIIFPSFFTFYNDFKDSSQDVITTIDNMCTDNAKYNSIDKYLSSSYLGRINQRERNNLDQLLWKCTKVSNITKLYKNTNNGISTFNLVGTLNYIDNRTQKIDFLFIYEKGMWKIQEMNFS